MPVLKWIVFGKAKLSLGGKLKEEYAVMRKYRALFAEFSRFNKIHSFDDEKVNELSDLIKERESDPDFDDSHVLALLIVSKSKLFCTYDSRNFKFIKKIKSYQKTAIRPKILTTNGHRLKTSLINDINLCDLEDHCELKKEVADYIFELIVEN